MISVIVPSQGRTFRLEKCLQSLAVQSFRDFEVRVVLNNTEPNFDGFLFRKRMSGIIPGVVILRSENPGANRARNLGAENALGDTFLFLDDDVQLPSSQYLEELLQSGLGPTTSFYQSPCFATISDRFYNQWSNLWLRLHAPAFLAGVLFISRSVFFECGGFSEKAEGVAEEFRLIQALRKRTGIEIAPDLAVHHASGLTKSELFKKLRRHLAGPRLKS